MGSPRERDSAATQLSRTARSPLPHRARWRLPDSHRHSPASTNDLVVATDACDYPLTLHHLLHSAPTCSPEREIVHASRSRHDYRELRRRIGRLAAGLASLGMERGTTVSVVDRDSPRYLECFFAIPMMGAVLHTLGAMGAIASGDRWCWWCWKTLVTHRRSPRFGPEIREAADGGRINRWAVPDRIEFVDSLDKTNVGKIDKKRLRVRYANPGSVR